MPGNVHDVVDPTQQPKVAVLVTLGAIAREIGPIAKPRQIMLTPELPKTRSGKIMRRLLRDVADDRPLGDVTTLLDPSVVNSIKEHLAEGGGEDKE